MFDFPDAVDCLPFHACDDDTIEDQVKEMIQQHEQSYEQQLLLSCADRVTCDDQLSGSGAMTTNALISTSFFGTLVGTILLLLI